ncbi:hypothetical protein BDB01DRAFT_577366 [Pilobolus umbonatus]|nr:hypothetical protein BDB01DRAFT_577366 [Pilobolus umbonatus]
MDYAAPEFILDNNICQENDMFSLGCLAYAVHNKGISLLKTFNNYHTYEKQVKSITAQSVSTMPVHLQDVIRSLLVRHPTQRMSAVEFQNSKYFDNLLVSTMKFMESFPEKTREEKAQFMKGLSKVLNQFPERVLKRKILPSLLEELKDAQLLPYTIPNIFLISEKLNQHEFCDIVLPALKPIFQVREPPQNMIVLLEKLDILQQKTPRETFRDDVMPLVYAALESPTALVQEKALRIIPSLSELLDYTAIKSSLFPRVQAVFVQTTILSVKVSTLICFHSIIKVLDKFTVQEKLVPLLKNIKTKEPAVMLATLAVYDEIGKIADKEIIATELLPQLWRMSFGPLLNLDQFQKFMKTIHSLTKKVEEAHLRHLKEIKSLEDQTRSVSATNTPQTTHISIGEDTPVSFESLVQNKKPSLENNRPTTSDDDMFSSLQGSAPQTNTWNNNKLNQPVLSPMSTSNTASWNSPNLAPSSIPNTNNILNNKWNSQFNQLPSNGQGWQMKTSPSLSNTNTISASAVNNSQNRQMTNSINWSTTTSIPSLVSPPSFQSTMNQMNQLSLNPTPSDNYNSLRTTPQQQLNNHVLMPLSSGMGLLQPTPNTQHTNPPKKHINIHAFDPLG